MVTPWVLNTVTEPQDNIIRVSEDNCPRFDQVLRAVQADPAVVKMIEDVNQDLEAAFFPELRKLVNMPDADAEKLTSLCNYFYWATTNGLELKI